jgi:fused signal recognition particle receptor
MFKGIGQALKRSREQWFGKVTQLFERSSIDKALWEELEELLVSADVGMDTTLKIVKNVQDRIKRDKLDTNQQVFDALKREMADVINVRSNGGDANVKETSPWIILVVGVNGSGKTTSIAKLANKYKAEGNRVILAAADTFRAAADDQLQTWAERVGVDVISHRPGADPGAVVYDAIQAARSRSADIVIIDTAGRLHTKYNLMEELKKIRRVAQGINEAAPHEVLLVLDATTGQNGLTQAKYFTEAVGVSGILLAKLDSTAKGGIVLAICDQLNIPIEFVGTGEGLEDLSSFNADSFIEALMS